MLDLSWGVPTEEVKLCKHKAKQWYKLLNIALTQWSYARCLEHIPDLLRACAALDMRTEVQRSDYTLLYKLLKPMQLEPYIIKSVGFESGRLFQNNVYCLLVELASHGQPTVADICVDYKVAPSTTYKIVSEHPEWVWTKRNSPTRIMPTEHTNKILKLLGVNQKW